MLSHFWFGDRECIRAVKSCRRSSVKVSRFIAVCTWHNFTFEGYLDHLPAAASALGSLLWCWGWTAIAGGIHSASCHSGCITCPIDGRIGNVLRRPFTYVCLYMCVCVHLSVNEIMRKWLKWLASAIGLQMILFHFEWNLIR